ncbi:MAG: hypothetical protein ACLQKH_11575 [Steroidobacteraceae bacterium]
MRIAAEQALMLAQRSFDFDVFGQYGDVVDAEPVGRLALGLQEIPYAVLGHDARGFPSQCAAQGFGAL